MDTFCNNCGKIGHSYHQCKMPIISMGVISYIMDDAGEYRFLMICRKDTLGFMDFMRGKYSIYNKEYIINLLKEMTIKEREILLNNDFDSIWKMLWSNSYMSMQYKIEESESRDKYNALVLGIMTQTGTYTLAELVAESNTYTNWEEAEWGFPKGRRNFNEKDMDCAIREFVEETGYGAESLKYIENIQAFEEIFMGSNYKSYKHKYYLMKMIEPIHQTSAHDNSEVSKVEWKTFNETLECIRPYNLEKKRLIENVYKCLTEYKITT